MILLLGEYDVSMYENECVHWVKVRFLAFSVSNDKKRDKFKESFIQKNLLPYFHSFSLRSE